MEKTKQRTLRSSLVRKKRKPRSTAYGYPTSSTPEIRIRKKERPLSVLRNEAVIFLTIFIQFWTKLFSIYIQVLNLIDWKI